MNKFNYNSNLIKGSAAIQDTKILLKAWQPELSIQENSQRIINENLLGKKSRKRTSEMISRILLPRYINGHPPNHWQYLKRLAESQISNEIFNSILYFYCSLNEPLIRDMMNEKLLPKYKLGALEINFQEILNFIKDGINLNRIPVVWSEIVQKKVASGLYAALTEFGILEGSKKRKIASKIISLPVFYYISFFLYKQENLSGQNLLNSQLWNLFLLNSTEIEHLFMEAHALKYLRFEQLGNLIRIDFFENNFEEAVDVVIARSV